jgi:hypothetical protein
MLDLLLSVTSTSTTTPRILESRCRQTQSQVEAAQTSSLISFKTQIQIDIQRVKQVE